jgi:hypothetical protein
LTFIARRRARREFVAGQPPPGQGDNVSSQEEYRQFQELNQFGVGFICLKKEIRESNADVLFL